MRTWLLIILTFGLCNCGVKGKPLPPEEAPEIGYGRPYYRGANQKIEEGKEEPDDRNKTQKKSEP